MKSPQVCREISYASAAMVIVAGLLTGCAATDPATEQASGDVQNRGMARMQGSMPPGAPTQSGASGQSNMQLPTFPQKFDVQGPESDSFGFAVTQPGPVVVEVQSQGAPVIVTLQGPAPQPISQQGVGQIRLTYTVTPQDVQKSVLWGVQIRLAQPAPLQLGGRAGGSVMVQSPPVNQAAVQQAVQGLAAQQQQPTPQEQQQRGARAAAQMEQAFQQRKAQFDRQQLDRRAAMMSQIQPQLDQLRSRMGGQIRPRGLEESAGTSGEPGAPPEGEIGTRALRGDRLSSTIEKPMDLQRAPAIIQAPQTATSQQPITSAGSGPPPQQVMPNPTIASLSVGQGQPGDPVMITGSGFGNGGGQVHFVIAPGKDLVVPIGVVWNDNQIFATVPDASGVLGFNGTVYINRAGDNVNSNLVPFRFNPALEMRELRSTMDRILQRPYAIDTNANEIAHNGAGDFGGDKGNDELFVMSKLKNGWVVDDVFVTPSYIFGVGGAYVWDARKGTDSPYLNARWWRNWFSAINYNFSVRIVGPKGVPDGIAVP